MKEKILACGLVRFLTGLKLWKAVSGSKVFGRFCTYEVISYLVVGVLTTIVDYVVYFICRANGLGVTGAEIIAWVLAVIFAYITNKVFVFLSTDWTGQAVLREIGSFISTRLFSLAVNVVLLKLTIEMWHLNEPAMKILASVVVLVINYIGSKLFVFAAGKEKKGEENA